MAKRKKLKLNKRLKKLKGSPYRSLFAAALAIPAVALSFPVFSQEKAMDTKVKFFYADYHDYDRYDDRMHVQEPIAWIKTPLSEDLDLEGSFTLDSMSGASTYYHNSLTGASGQGVEDTRRAYDLKLTKFQEGYSVSIGGALSDEDDYDSASGLIETSIWSEDKNTTFTLGFSGSSDDITSSIAQNLDESRRTFNFILGVTQVLDVNSVLQSNLSYTNGDGFFSDPYKTLDKRPESRDQFAWLNRYNRYIESWDASLHCDYRYYDDSWGINSHMLEFALYKPIGESFLIRPNIRYYSQSAADFFADPFPPEDLEQFITGDQRLSAFGGLTTGVKFTAQMGSGFSADFLFSYLMQRSEWKLGGGGSDVIEPFRARILAVSLTKAF
jgi:hypothetical protein